MVYFPNKVFTNIIGFCNDTPIQKHRKIMKDIIKDIDLFLDLYSKIITKWLLTWNNEGYSTNHTYEDYLSPIMFRTKLHFFVDDVYNETEHVNYDFDRIDRIDFTYIEENDIIRWSRLPPRVRD